MENNTSKNNAPEVTNKLLRNSTCIEGPTWRDLIDFITRNIDAKYYDTPVRLLIGDNASVQLTSIETWEEDIYMLKSDIDNGSDPDDADCGTIEDLKLSHGEKCNLEDYVVVTAKGKPFLYYNEEN